MKFSQRIGKEPIKNVLQVESIDDDLKNTLWNFILEEFFGRMDDYAPHGQETLKGNICKIIWKDFFKYRIDNIPSYSNSNKIYVIGFINELREWYFFKAKWYDIYDFIEFVILIDYKILKLSLVEDINWILAKEVSGYRVVNEKIVQITSEEEIKAIEEATISTDKWKSVSTHLQVALDELSNKNNPNYRNSIKESVSAVESFCRIITKDDKATLGNALIEIEKTHKLHGALKSAFSSIYGYTSDSSGIRHSLLESDTKVEFEDAKFMLVSCSAFISYLKVKVDL